MRDCEVRRARIRLRAWKLSCPIVVRMAYHIIAQHYPSLGGLGGWNDLIELIRTVQGKRELQRSLTDLLHDESSVHFRSGPPNGNCFLGKGTALSLRC